MTSRHRNIVLAAVSALALLGGAALLAAQPSWETGEQRRAVGDWLVEDVEDPGHGWLVSMRRETDEYNIGYRIQLNALGAPPVEIYEVIRLNCGKGGGDAIEGGRAYGDRDQVRAQLVDYLVQCEMSPEEAEEAVQGFERAFAVAAGWADERAAEMASYDTGMEMVAANAIDEMGMMAENAAEMDMAVDMNTTMDMNAADMDMMMDTNAMADMNWTADATDMPTNSSEPK